ncbi:MAG: LysR family transcriptional regulator [Betaproteobacteria bacterium]|jgi:DNA-binding transcriptional LysR family regulator|nr:LysR family transcriptional regulator [Betaproteobacteria bacterium]
MKNLSLRQIRIFSAAARHLSFSRAAEEMHLSAPAVSMQIKELEEELGSALFLRSGRKVALTPAGETFRIYAEKVLSALLEAEAVMQTIQGAKTKPPTPNQDAK